MSIFLWWLSLFLIGVAFFPLTQYIFKNFEDRGWIFSKVLGFFLVGWTMWAMNVGHWLRFQKSNIWFLLVVFALANYGIYFWKKSRNMKELLSFHRKTVIIEEAVFTGLYLLAVYIVGFKPSAYGTEKFMDYAFMTAMMRADYMPFPDPWFAGSSINYYYGGQYLASFLMKMTGSAAGMSYNLMRACVTAFSFVLPFSLVYQLMRDKVTKMQEHGGIFHKRAPWAAATLGGLAVAFCGNFHYVIFGIFKKITGGADYSYWFPDSTRYIGYNPDMPDKTIHEFPAYSSVLGDLHAHYVNILFVVLVAAIAYAWAQTEDIRRKPRDIPMLSVEIALIGMLTGVFRWTNFWDFPIYYVTCGSIIFFTNLRTYKGKIKEFIFVMVSEAAEMFLIGYLAALPFTSSFDQISSEIALTHSHTMVYQLVILWGLPAGLLLFYAVTLILEKRAAMSAARGVRYIDQREIEFMDLPDLAVLMFGLCAAGLVFLPEVIYVKDIYGADHYRANTMFKLTYQAFILFGMCMGYIIVRTLIAKGKRVTVSRVIASAGLVCLLLTSGYIGQSVYSWFGNIFIPSNRINTDASVFVSTDFASDFEGINYLNSSVSGQPTILEAPGDSYSGYERVSVATGLPTVAGWYVHEWLWRGGHEELDVRNANIETIYTSTATGTVRSLLEQYGVSYIYVGSLEREKYPGLSDDTLKSMGNVVYESEDGQTYIVAVAPTS
ncbi:MAG: DUF2298 domain-containing protein [Lachnospiraceae bacterium]|nr:DUF2298 domain-containing protein [Lachnospiraceae bacterium]